MSSLWQKPEVSVKLLLIDFWFMRPNYSPDEPDGYTEPSEKSSLETIWETFKKKCQAGEKMNHLSVTVYHQLTKTNQVNELCGVPEAIWEKHVFQGVKYDDATAASTLTSWGAAVVVFKHRRFLLSFHYICTICSIFVLSNIQSLRLKNVRVKRESFTANNWGGINCNFLLCLL